MERGRGRWRGEEGGRERKREVERGRGRWRGEEGGGEGREKRGKGKGREERKGGGKGGKKESRKSNHVTCQLDSLAPRPSSPVLQVGGLGTRLPIEHGQKEPDICVEGDHLNNAFVNHPGSEGGVTAVRLETAPGAI